MTQSNGRQHTQLRQLRTISGHISPPNIPSSRSNRTNVTVEELSSSRIAEREAKLKEIPITGLPSYDEAIKIASYDMPPSTAPPMPHIFSPQFPSQPPSYYDSVR